MQTNQSARFAKGLWGSLSKAGSPGVDAEGKEGVWVTVQGRAIFIRNGESLDQAADRTGTSLKQEGKAPAGEKAPATAAGKVSETLAEITPKPGDTEIKQPIHTIDEAIEQLKNGKGVMFEKPAQAVMLLDKMAALAKAAKEKGEKAQVFDLCKVTVKGASLFCHQNMQIPRDQMPQLTGKPRPDTPADKLPRNQWGEVDLTEPFLKKLAGMGVKVEQTDVQSSKMRATQNQLDGTKVGGIMKSMEGGFTNPRIFVSKEDYVVDGHHRWAATVGVEYKQGKEVNMPVYRVDMPILDLIKLSNEFSAEQGVGQAGLGKSLAKQELQVPEPVTVSDGTIVSTEVPKRSPVVVTSSPYRAPQKLPKPGPDQLKNARAARIRISLALRGFKNDPSVPRFNELKRFFAALDSALAKVVGKVASRPGGQDAASDGRFNLREGRKGIRAATGWLHQGDFDKVVEFLDLTLEHYDEALQDLQRTVPALFRR